MISHLIDLVSLRYQSSFASVSKEIATLFVDSGIKNYHKHSHLIEHKKQWKKIFRMFSPCHVSSFEKLDTFKYLHSLFGPFKISDEENLVTLIYIGV